MNASCVACSTPSCRLLILTGELALSALEPCAHDAPEALWLIDCAPPERQPPPIALYEARFTSA